MKKIHFATLVLVSSLAALSGPAAAFNLPKVPSLGGGSGGTTVNAAEVARNARNALHAFAKAEIGLAAALGGYTDLAAHQQLLDNLKVGDVAASKEDVETLVVIHKSADQFINQKIGENAALSAENKALAASSLAAYVKGLVSSKKLVSSIQGVAKNPMALGPDASALLFLGKEVPGVVSGGASSTSALMKYLSANGVDVSEAKSAAGDLGT
mgnify:CR=1 FL=1